MTGDHHGQRVWSATLLVRAVDAILGTHKVDPFEGVTQREIRWQTTRRAPQTPGGT
jgi:hypothetical protein